MQFIKLKFQDPDGNSRAFFVNPLHVEFIEGSDNGTLIYFASGKVKRIDEDPTMIKSKLEQNNTNV